LPTKTGISKLIYDLKGDYINERRPDNKIITYIFDGNALLQALSCLPSTYEDFAEKVFEILPNCELGDFVRETYKAESIKSAERSRRGMRVTYLIKWNKTKVLRDWKGFLSNNENEKQLIKLILEGLS
jgi:hypothetical protein